MFLILLSDNLHRAQYDFNLKISRCVCAPMFSQVISNYDLIQSVYASPTNQPAELGSMTEHYNNNYTFRKIKTSLERNKVADIFYEMREIFLSRCTLNTGYCCAFNMQRIRVAMRCQHIAIQFSLTLSLPSSYEPHLYEISLNDFTWTINVR